MKRTLLMIAMLMAAVFLGSLIGEMAAGVDAIAWLGKSYSIGFSTFDLNLKIMVFTLGFQMNICIAQVLLVLVVLGVYPAVSSTLFPK